LVNHKPLTETRETRQNRSGMERHFLVQAPAPKNLM